MSYRHVVITRFSVRFNMDTEKRGVLFSEQRLDMRMKVFKTICLPSILNQTWKRFYWVILVDYMLPSKYRQELDKLALKHTFIRILQWKPEQYKLAYIDWLKDANIDIKCNHIITTRLDDDDALHQEFTNLVQKFYKCGGYKVKYIQFLTFPNGLIWMNNKGMNPFKMDFIALGMTLIVCTKTVPVNVYGFNHANLKRDFKLKLKNPPYIYKWLNNKLNRTFTHQHFQLRKAMVSINTKVPIYIYCIHSENDSAAKYYSNLFRNGGIYSTNTMYKLLKQFNLNYKNMNNL